MVTEVCKIDRKKPSRSVIRKAAKIILNGELVAFPTETVYGLGANGLAGEAVGKIFDVKRREPDNPLILHLGYKKDIFRCAAEVPLTARRLVKRFWPGPLTIVLKKNQAIPDIVTAGLETVALRMPDSVVALSLIRAAGVPLAAPSANISGKPSPTTAGHVYTDLNGKIRMIIDSGPANIGIESTIIDCSVDPPVILRPGMIEQKDIKRCIGLVDAYRANRNGSVLKPKSPGMKYRHYAPDAPLILLEGDPEAIRKGINGLIRKYRYQGKLIGILSFYPGHHYRLRTNEPLIRVSAKASSASRRLFSALRAFNKEDVDVILAESFPSPEHAITNRLRKAATKIIKV